MCHQTMNHPQWFDIYLDPGATTAYSLCPALVWPDEAENPKRHWCWFFITNHVYINNKRNYLPEEFHHLSKSVSTDRYRSIRRLHAVFTRQAHQLHIYSMQFSTKKEQHTSAIHLHTSGIASLKQAANSGGVKNCTGGGLTFQQKCTCLCSDTKNGFVSFSNCRGMLTFFNSQFEILASKMLPQKLKTALLKQWVMSQTFCLLLYTGSVKTEPRFSY